MRKNAINTEGGFSLVEIAIVLVIIAIFMGTAIKGTSAIVQRSRYAQARADITLAKEAILGFLYQNQRLPCADVADLTNTLYPVPFFPSLRPDGLEDEVGAGAGQSCQLSGGVSFGYLPAATLGVEGIDPWGTPYFYRVTPGFADVAPSPNLGEEPSFDLTTFGDINIQDNLANTIAQQVPYIVFSVGANRDVVGGVGSPALEAANLDFDVNYVSTTFSSGAGVEFDDVMEWMSINVLKAKLVEADILP